MNFTGMVTFPYVISDGNGGTATADEVITITPVNDPPVAVDDFYTVPEDGMVTLTPLDLDTDLDGDMLSILSINGISLTLGTPEMITVPNGIVDVDAVGVIIFTPDPDYTGPVTFPYVVTDGTATDEADEVIDVTPVNDPPVAVDDSYTVPEDGTATLTPLNLDTDLDGDMLSILSINGIPLTLGTPEMITVPSGTVDIDAAGVITFIPDPDYTGPVTFPYVITDGTATDEANEVIDVTPVNDPPVAVDDFYTVPEDGMVTLTPLDLDTDLDGDMLSILSINGIPLTLGTPEMITVPNGTVDIDAAGVITFTPDPDYTGPVTFPYVVTDGTATDEADEVIDVTPVNDPPVAVDDSYTVPEDGMVTLTPLDLDTDLDGDMLSILSINGIPLTLGTPEMITVPNGTVDIDAAGVITFIPDPDYTGPVTFPYVVTDGTATDEANEVIDVTPVNDPPVAVDDFYTVPEDGMVTLTPLNLDTDLDGDMLSILSINGIPLTLGTPEVIMVPNGIVDIDAAGVITFTPDPDYTGPVTFPYVVTDGTATDEADEVIDVTPVNDPPVAVDDFYTVPEDGMVTLTPLNLDTDLDGDMLSILSINGIPLTLGTPEMITVPNGTVDIDAAGVITFIPDPDYTGPVTFPYVVTDGTATDEANEVIDVTPVNDPPVAVDDFYTVPEDGTVTLTPLDLDTDLDGDMLSILSINGIPLTPGTPEVIMVPNGIVDVDAAGVITFTPDPDYTGPVTFPYVVTDGTATDEANEVIDVTPVNDPPVAVDDSYTVPEDGTVTLTPLNLDTDLDGDMLSILSINGIPLTLGTPEMITVPNGTVDIDAAGVITFIPDPDYTGPVTFPYFVTDGTATDEADEVIDVTPVNDPPVAVDDSYTVPEDGTATLTPLNLDTDLDGDMLSILSINGIPLTLGTPEMITVPNGTVDIDAAGVITFIPDPDYTGPVTFPYVVTDGTATDEGNEVIDVTPVNDPPLAVDDFYTVPEDGMVTLTPLNLDTDLDGDMLSILSINGIPLTLGTPEMITVPNGTVDIDAAGVITFIPDPDYTGPVTFPYVVTDGTATDEANEVIDVTPVNDPPVAVDDFYTVPEDGTVTLTPLDLDTDLDGDLLSILSINGISLTLGTPEMITVPNGTVDIDAAGVITFIPDPDYTGPVTFPYVVTDGTATDEANEIIDVTPVIDLPIATNNESLANPAGPVIQEVVLEDDGDGVDSDPDGKLVASSLDLDPGTVGQ
jgi:hypothetical protein